MGTLQSPESGTLRELSVNPVFTQQVGTAHLLCVTVSEVSVVSTVELDTWWEDNSIVKG